MRHITGSARITVALADGQSAVRFHADNIRLDGGRWTICGETPELAVASFLSDYEFQAHGGRYLVSVSVDGVRGDTTFRPLVDHVAVEEVRYMSGPTRTAVVWDGFAWVHQKIEPERTFYRILLKLIDPSDWRVDEP